MASIQWERSSEPTHAESVEQPRQTATDWITEHQDVAVERLFALLEQNQLALAALAQAWRQTSRALELTQAQLAQAERKLTAERHIHRLTADG